VDVSDFYGILIERFGGGKRDTEVVGKETTAERKSDTVD